MVVPHLTQEELLQLLKDNGWTVVSDKHWGDFARVMVSNGKTSIPIQLLRTYFYPMVVKLCEDLDIIPPEKHKKAYDQHYRSKGKGSK